MWRKSWRKAPLPNTTTVARQPLFALCKISSKNMWSAYWSCFSALGISLTRLHLKSQSTNDALRGSWVRTTRQKDPRWKVEQEMASVLLTGTPREEKENKKELGAWVGDASNHHGTLRGLRFARTQKSPTMTEQGCWLRWWEGGTKGSAIVVEEQ